MAVYDIIPSQNVDYNDVRDTLNASGGSVNNTMSSLFAEAAKLNMWSDISPCEIPNTPFADFSQIRKYKFKKATEYKGVSGSWAVFNPATTIFRLGDFRKYARNTTPPTVSVRIDYTEGQTYSLVSVGVESIIDYDFSNVVNIDSYAYIVNVNGYDIKATPDGSGGYYGSAECQFQASSSANYPYYVGIGQVKADGTISDMLFRIGCEYNGEDFGVGTVKANIYVSDKPTEVQFINPWPIEFTDVNKSVSIGSSTSKSKVTVSFKALNYTDIPSTDRTKTIMCYVRNQKTGETVFPSTSFGSFTIRTTNTINIEVDYQYNSQNLIYVVSLE